MFPRVFYLCTICEEIMRLFPKCHTIAKYPHTVNLLFFEEWCIRFTLLSFLARKMVPWMIFSRKTHTHHYLFISLKWHGCILQFTLR
jgi:hypothetical protein